MRTSSSWMWCSHIMSKFLHLYSAHILLNFRVKHFKIGILLWAPAPPHPYWHPPIPQAKKGYLKLFWKLQLKLIINLPWKSNYIKSLQSKAPPSNSRDKNLKWGKAHFMLPRYFFALKYHDLIAIISAPDLHLLMSNLICSLPNWLITVQ